MTDEINLTIDWNRIEDTLAGIRVNMDVDGLPWPVQVENESFLVLEQRGRCRLSDETREREEERLAKLGRKKKSLRQRKKYTRKKGTVHPKKKEATKRKARARRWAKDPHSCIRNSYGVWKLDKALFDEHILPLWKKHNPAHLKVVRKGGKGTQQEPHTVFNIQIVDSTTNSVLYDGSSLELYLLSS